MIPVALLLLCAIVAGLVHNRGTLTLAEEERLLRDYFRRIDPD